MELYKVDDIGENYYVLENVENEEELKLCAGDELYNSLVENYEVYLDDYFLLNKGEWFKVCKHRKRYNFGRSNRSESLINECVCNHDDLLGLKKNIHIQKYILDDDEWIIDFMDSLLHSLIELNINTGYSVSRDVFEHYKVYIRKSLKEKRKD